MAHGLSSLIAPSSLKSHHSVSSNDRVIWDSAYNEEYHGVKSRPTWEIITESQFMQLNEGVEALPSMTIATIKCN